MSYTYYTKDGCYKVDYYVDIPPHKFLHRVDGPALIFYSDDEIYFEEWYNNGLKHREDGPAYILYQRRRYEWWYHGVRYTMNAYLEKSKTIKDKVHFKLVWS